MFHSEPIPDTDGVVGHRPIDEDPGFQSVFGYIAAGGVAIGYVDEIYGAAAVLVSTKVTKAEVERLARSYLADVHLKDVYTFLHEQYSSIVSRMCAYAWLRLDQFLEAGLITEARLAELRDECLTDPEELMRARERAELEAEENEGSDPPPA